MTSPLALEEYSALAAFRYELRKFLRFSRDYLAKEARLTPEQYEALLALKAFSGPDGFSVGELSERLQVKHHTAVALTDKLASRKLAAKRRDETNRRKVCVTLTGSGEALLAKLAIAHRRQLKGQCA